jgi:D-glycero-D-manno-heptose 1,7-bisphosphate phosphatase
VRPAVFLDRDGTLIEHVHYLTDPDDVRLIAGAAEAVRRLQERGYACVVATNQSAVGRGMLDLEGLERIHEVMNAQLDAHGVKLDGVYFCTLAPESADRTVIEHADRKPGPGMLQRAAAELDLDLAASWMVGDSISDLLAGVNAGCAGSILVLTGAGNEVDRTHDAVRHVVPDLTAAAELILSA